MIRPSTSRAAFHLWDSDSPSFGSEQGPAMADATVRELVNFGFSEDRAREAAGPSQVVAV